jgi:hypothetical protein
LSDQRNLKNRPFSVFGAINTEQQRYFPKGQKAYFKEFTQVSEMVLWLPIFHPKKDNSILATYPGIFHAIANEDGSRHVDFNTPKVREGLQVVANVFAVPDRYSEQIVEIRGFAAGRNRILGRNPFVGEFLKRIINPTFENATDDQVKAHKSQKKEAEETKETHETILSAHLTKIQKRLAAMLENEENGEKAVNIRCLQYFAQDSGQSLS